MYYLKWHDDIVGIIDNEFNVKFINPNLNKVVAIITDGKDSWDKKQLSEFLSDRIVSKDRRDIDKILFRLSMSDYDVIKIAVKTSAINPRDMLWIAKDKDDKMIDALGGSFENIFKQSINDEGVTNSSPDGQNIKEYFIADNSYGIKKQRLHGLSTDAENEVVVYNLGALLGVRVCKAWMLPDNSVFSKYEYDFTKEYLVHARAYFKDGERTGELYKDLIKKFPQFKADIQRMILLDFITRQDDRHLSNFAICEAADTSYFYSLYDNGRSLFHSENEKFISDSVADIEAYSTSFGEIGTYYDTVNDIMKDTDIRNLINLNISNKQAYAIIKGSGISDYRLDGSTEWICKCIEYLKRKST